MLLKPLKTTAWIVDLMMRSRDAIVAYAGELKTRGIEESV